MRIRKWRALLASGGAAAALAVGVVVALPAAADPIVDGSKFRIMAQSSVGIGFCLTQNGRLRMSCHVEADVYSFRVGRCSPEPVCYRIITPEGECLVRDLVGKVGHEPCSKNPWQVWWMDRFDKPRDTIRLRSLAYNDCLLYDPVRLSDSRVGRVSHGPCADYPSSHALLTLLWV